MIFPCRVCPKSGLAGSVGLLFTCTVSSEWLRLDSRFSSWLPTFRLRMPFAITWRRSLVVMKMLASGRNREQ